MITSLNPIRNSEIYKKYLKLKKKNKLPTCFGCFKEIEDWTKEGMLMPNLADSRGGLWVHQTEECFDKFFENLKSGESNKEESEENRK